jgi:glutathione S-transferase
MITVYHLDSSRSQRILWLLEELGIDSRLERFSRDSTGRAPEEYRQVHALGKSPAIRDGDLTSAATSASVRDFARIWPGFANDRRTDGRSRPGSEDR